jgi:polyisoprenoid-binding protein YceI
MTRSTRLFVTILGCAGMLLAADLRQPAAFVIDPVRTHVEFVLGSTLHTIHGTFRLTRGDLHFDPATGAAGGELAVDAGSGDSGSAARDKRMNNSILETPKFPEVVFRPDHVEGTVAPQGKSRVQLRGMFWLHGTAHEMTVPLTVDANNGEYQATATFAIPYVKWGLKNPSTLILRVNDKVDITVHTVAHMRS